MQTLGYDFKWAKRKEYKAYAKKQKKVRKKLIKQREKQAKIKKKILKQRMEPGEPKARPA